MREKILQSIRERALLRAGNRVAVAVSGGADSVALLRVLLELRTDLGIVLAVAHFNHGLRGEESAADEAFVADLAKHLGLELHAGRGVVREHSLNAKLSIEAAGRELRYGWLTSLAEEQRLDAIATAHTLDDQAETVLLKLLRGAGTRGLAGIYPLVEMVRESSASSLRIVRPLLCVSRGDVECYLASLNQAWREDESNRDRRFLRNRVRHDLLPLLEREFNPSIRRGLSDLAEVSRGEEEFWREQAASELAKRSANRESGDKLSLDSFRQLPIALQRRLVKSYAERQGLALHFEHVEALRGCALGKDSKVELPGGRIAVNDRKSLTLRQPNLECGKDYSYVLPIPGEVHIPDLSMTLRAHLVSAVFAEEAPPGNLLSLNLLGPQLIVRNWRHGDRFWPAHCRSEEKLKRLFAEKRVPAAERPSWPVALCDDEIVWVRGFPVAQTRRWTGDGPAVRIEAIP